MTNIVAVAIQDPEDYIASSEKPLDVAAHNQMTRTSIQALAQRNQKSFFR